MSLDPRGTPVPRSPRVQTNMGTTIYIEGFQWSHLLMVAERRLPPGQREVRKWPRLDLGIVPRFDPKEWDLRVDGSVDKTISITYDGLLRFPYAKVVCPFACVTGWTTFDNDSLGVTLNVVSAGTQI